MHSSRTLGFLGIFVLAACGRGADSEEGSADSSGGASAQSASSGRPDSTGSARAETPPPPLLDSDADDRCCAAHSSPGCDNQAVAECVCAQDSYCCSKGWDSVCARHVEELGCGICSEPEDGFAGAGGNDGQQAGDPASIPEPSSNWSSCCAAMSGPGCGDPVIEECVCYVDAYCCESKWDSYCASEITELGCGSCSAFEGEGEDGSAGAGEGSGEGGAAGAGGSG